MISGCTEAVLFLPKYCWQVMCSHILSVGFPSAFATPDGLFTEAPEGHRCKSTASAGETAASRVGLDSQQTRPVVETIDTPFVNSP